MRKWIFILSALLAVWCCNREDEPENNQEDSKGRVSLTFTLTAEEGAPTKTLGEAYELNTVNIAVFGGSGYLKEYQTVTPVSKGGNKYECTISLPLSNSKRRVHILGNGPSGIPFGRDYDVLPPLMGEAGATGYWQLVLLDNVTAVEDAEGNLVPSDELKAAFENVPLIRNWAKIELVSLDGSHFTPKSFAVVNAPTKGTIVPYGGEKGFITNYKDLSFAQLVDEEGEYKYSGNLPSAKAEFTPLTLTKDDFINMTNGVVAYKASVPSGETPPAVYLYERPVPDGNIEPTYVIVYGTYYNPSDLSLPTSPVNERDEGVDCFYKLDLMSGGEYYPILRNFKYSIQIQSISARGYNTPAEAANSAGSADVSADVNASQLPDISDGKRRMAIQPWMAHTYLEAKQKNSEDPDLFVVFYDDITEGESALPNMKLNSVYYELIPSDAGIIKDVEIGKPVGFDDLPNIPEPENRPNNYGWRSISYSIASPLEAHARSQTLRILCKTNKEDTEESPLYRDIVISLLPVQTMRVNCGESRILKKKGTVVKVDIDIPDGLVESMFPLVFNIEAKNLTLTPDDSQTDHVLPVVYGKTIVDNSGKQSFYFQRTVSWSEYLGLTSHLDWEEESRWRTFSSYFKTNCDDSHSEVYVANRFFYTGKTFFNNIESFGNPVFSTSIPYDIGGSVDVKASMMTQQDNYETVYLDLKNLVPADENWKPETSGQFAGKYAYKPTTQDMTFALKTTAQGGDVAVTLSTESGAYEPVTLTPWHFTNARFVDGIIMPGKTNLGDYSNVIWGYVNSVGNNKQVLLGYNTDPDNKHPKVRVINNGGGVTIPKDYASENGYDTSQQHKNYNGQDNYHWVSMDNKSGSIENVSLSLSAVGYAELPVTAGRYNGDAYVLDINTDQIAQLIQDGGQYTKVVEVNKRKCTFSLQIASSDATQSHKPEAHSSGGFLLPAGARYRWDAQITSDHGDVFLYYVQIVYYYDETGQTLMKPRSAEPEQDECNYFGYQGNYNDFIWELSSRKTGGSLIMNPYSDKGIVVTRVILRGFHGKLYSNGDLGDGDFGFGDDIGDGGRL